MIGTEKMTKKLWYAAGGLSNPRLFRKMRNGAWIHWRVTT